MTITDARERTMNVRSQTRELLVRDILAQEDDAVTDAMAPNPSFGYVVYSAVEDAEHLPWDDGP